MIWNGAKSPIVARYARYPNPRAYRGQCSQKIDKINTCILINGNGNHN